MGVNASRSKVLAERAAWDAVAGSATALVAINPCYVQGPLTSARPCSSFTLVRRMLSGDAPAVANLGLQLCDMRDVAAAHVAALSAPRAPGQRYIIHSASVFGPDVAALLRDHYTPRGYPVPALRAPRALLSVVALFDAEVRALLPNVDKQRLYDGSKAARELGIACRSWQEAVLATADSLIRMGVVAPKHAAAA